MPRPASILIEPARQLYASRLAVTLRAKMRLQEKLGLTADNFLHFRCRFYRVRADYSFAFVVARCFRNARRRKHLAFVLAGRFWCHCRQVYLPMCYVYGKRFVGKETSLVLALREELFSIPYSQVDWDRARNQCAKEDLYYPHPLLQVGMRTVTNGLTLRSPISKYEWVGVCET